MSGQELSGCGGLADTCEGCNDCLREFEARLLAAQKDLEPEAAAVLYANLWDLYD